MQFFKHLTCIFYFFVFYYYFFSYILAVEFFVAAHGLSLSVVRERCSLIAVQGPLLAVVSLVVQHGLQACGLQQLQHVDSIAVAHGLSCSTACRIFQGQGWTWYSLYCKAESPGKPHAVLKSEKSSISKKEKKINKERKYSTKIKKINRINYNIISEK